MIVFVGLDGNIYTVNPWDYSRVAITHDSITGTAGGPEYYYPAWAPDGKQIAKELVYD